MAFRVYDMKKQKWVKDNIYLSPNDELFLIKQSLFGMVKIPLELSQDRYTWHKAIDLLDKYKVSIYEGDYLQANIDEDRTEIGLVTYAQELSAYVILCVDSDNFYTLGTDIVNNIKVIGNVFDGYLSEDN